MHHFMQPRNVQVGDYQIQHGDIWTVSETEHFVILVLTETDDERIMGLVLVNAWNGTYQHIEYITSNTKLLEAAITNLSGEDYA
jgi:hypothetical protein